MTTDRQPGMSMIVRTVTRWLKGPILLFGIYIVLYGHLTPGGGFGGGVIIASAFILVMLAMGEEHGLGIFSKGVAGRLDSGGLLAFLLLGSLGAWYGGYFFENIPATPESAQFTLPSAGLMPLLNIALAFKVASALFLVFAVLTAIHILPGLHEPVGFNGESLETAGDNASPEDDNGIAGSGIAGESREGAP